MSLSLSLLPACAGHMLVCIRPSYTTQYPRLSRSEPGRLRVNAPPWRVGSPPPQGSSLGSGLFCPDPSSLNRPHPPHSQAHRDFTAERLIRDAFAVRERLGDPRVVPGFRCPFFPDLPPSMTPGSFNIVMVQFLRCRTWPSPGSEQLGTPIYPAIRFTQGTYFGASPVHLRYGLSGCSPSLDGSDQVSPASEDFYFQAFDRSVALPAAGYDYNSVLDSFCWRDFHPQEWQLASLHQIRTCPIQAFGSHLGCVTAKRWSGQG
jgi:hypothetical protein